MGFGPLYGKATDPDGHKKRNRRFHLGRVHDSLNVVQARIIFKALRVKALRGFSSQVGTLVERIMQTRIVCGCVDIGPIGHKGAQGSADEPAIMTLHGLTTNRTQVMLQTGIDLFGVVDLKAGFAGIVDQDDERYGQAPVIPG